MQTISLKNLVKENQCNEREGFGYIYITTNLITGVKYIGQRFSTHIKGSFYNDTYLGSGTVLKRAIKEYGIENFTKEIIQICNSKEELNEAEKYWIKYYQANINTNGQFYNIAAGGNAGDTWTGKSDEYKEKFKEIIRTSNKNRQRKIENIQGECNPVFGKRWCNDGEHNYLLTLEEIRQNDYVLGMIRTPEHNAKISAANKGRKHNYSSTQNCICYNNGNKNKFIHLDEATYYEELGWVKGMINNRWEKNNELS